MNLQHILVVDDDPDTLSIVRQSLEWAGFRVRTAHSGETALKLIDRYGLPHLAIVDINMPPGMDGFAFCEEVRKRARLPIIFLTAQDEERVILRGIEKYAEDFIIKPFNPKELAARVQRVLRRIEDYSYRTELLDQFDADLYVDFERQQVFVEGETVELTPTEAKLLQVLVRNRGHVVPTGLLLQKLWPLEHAGSERLHIHVHRLRRKLEPFAVAQDCIVSERGVGYSFRAR